MHVYTNGHLPVTLRNIFVMNTDIHEHNTRHGLDPHVISRNSSAMSETFIHKVLSYGLRLTTMTQMLSV